MSACARAETNRLKETEAILLRYSFKDLAHAVETLHPAYFALVMATGIVAISAFFEGLRVIAVGLSWFNAVAFIILCVAYLLRLVFYPRSIIQDVPNFQRGPDFFTLVAGLNVAGSQAIIIFGNNNVALALWLASIPVWLFFTYAILFAFTVKECKPSLGEGINGGWLLLVVATQAISYLGTLLSARLPAQERNIVFFTFCMWLCGGMFCIWLSSLIFYRDMFFHFSPADLRPTFWINMGAMAISTVAGAALVKSLRVAPFLVGMVPFLKVFIVFYWVTATFWIPMLLILEFWRHVLNKFKFAYNPLYWGAVFPLGMYAASTHSLVDMLNLPILVWVQRIFVYAALVAWAATLFGLVRALISPATTAFQSK